MRKKNYLLECEISSGNTDKKVNYCAIEEYIKFILHKLINFYEPQQIYLFGSQARGEADENSDIDFLVIKETGLPRRQRVLDFRKELRGQNIYPVDILVYTPQEFFNEINLKGTIPYHVIQEGKLLYGSESIGIN